MKTRSLFAGLLILLLTSCSFTSKSETVSLPTTRVENTITLETFTPSPLPTFTLWPTFTPSPTLTPSPVPSPFPTFPALPVKAFSIDKFRTVFGDGKIYLQDGLNPPKPLTFSGLDRNPILSDDGEKIVFYRGKENNNVYSINADGSNELLIIESKSLPVISQGEITALQFIPNSHFVIFNTYLCNKSIPLSYNASDCTVGVHIVNTDSGERTTVASGLSGNRLHNHNFEVSPDGSHISIASSRHVDIYDFSIRAERAGFSHEAFSYRLTKPDEYLPNQYWYPDSTGFVTIVETSGYNEPTTPPLTYAAFHYSPIASKELIKIPLDKVIMREFGQVSWSISPDRNWIFFRADDSYRIGNLSNGQTQVYKGDVMEATSIRWSPDSKYFAFMDSAKSIGSVNGMEIIALDGFFIGWLDSSHYLYVNIKDADLKTARTYIGEIGGESVPAPDEFKWSPQSVLLNPENAP